LTTCALREWWERGSSPGGYLATSVDQLVTLLFAKYAREVAEALPSDQAYPLRGSEKRAARASNGLALWLISGFDPWRASMPKHYFSKLRTVIEPSSMRTIWPLLWIFGQI